MPEDNTLEPEVVYLLLLKKWKYVNYLYNLLQRHCSTQTEAFEMHVATEVNLPSTYLSQDFYLVEHIQSSLPLFASLIHCTEAVLFILYHHRKTLFTILS
jgi:hypothetical protein